MQLAVKSSLKMLPVALTMLLAGCQNDDAAEGGTLANPPEPTSAAFELVWSDEFDGDSLDLSRWEVQLGDGTSEGLPPGWGNNERQYYTARNISVESGMLAIQARAGDSPDPNFPFTSGRIRTQGMLDFVYGRVEARIKIPEGLGMWGAFWMLGSDPSPYGAWAARGEIDIMESFGQQTSFLQATTHYGMPFPLNESASIIRNDIDPTDGFHDYAIEWDSQRIRWFVDGEHYFTVSRDTYWNYFYDGRDVGFVPGAEDAPFNANQHILLNLAVGGNPAGIPDPSDASVFPGEMLVDYVRVYRCPFEPVADGLGCENSIDQVNPFVITQDGDRTPGPQDVVTVGYDLYTDSPSTLFAGTNGERPLGIGVFDNDGAFTWSEVAAEDPSHGMVLDIQSTGGGNIQINDPTGATFNLFGMGNAEDGQFFGGELVFDVYVFAEGTDSNGALQVTVDSGFPDVGFMRVPFSELPQGAWTRVSLPLSEVIQSNIGFFGGGPLDINEVVNLIVFEPVGAAHLQVDNVRLQCGAPMSRPCGIVSVATVPQDVYIDSVGPLWDFGIAAVDSGSGFATYTDGTNPDGVNKIEWAEVADADPVRGQVVEVTFNGSAETGVWFINASGMVNLSGYADGALVFDLLVSDYGNADGTMSMRVDCTFPCSSGDQNLGRVADGEWQTIEIPVAQLTAGGLDLAMLSSGIIVFPTNQADTVVFRVDNIRWEPTTTVQVAPAAPLAFQSDFEASDPTAGSLGDDWTSFGTAFDAQGQFVYNYGNTFPTPNNQGGFAAIVADQGGAEQGSQQLSLFSDYNNADHGNGLTIQADTFQQREIAAGHTGNYEFSFDARLPAENGLISPSTAVAYVQTLDPENGFTTTARADVDLSTLGQEWVRISISFSIDAEVQAGQLVQFGYTIGATNFEPSAILVDNVNFGLADPGIRFSANFEASDPAAPSIGDGWLSFANVANADGTPAYNYGPFDAPNNNGGFAAIATGEEGPEQGLQYLNIFSDYNNVDHGNGLVIQALTFQQRTLVASDSGNYRFSFDARAPLEGGIAAPTTAFAYVQTLDPENGFAVSSSAQIDMTSVSNTQWSNFSVDLMIDAEALQGHILQFGFANEATGFNPSGIFYDNIQFGPME